MDGIDYQPKHIRYNTLINTQPCTHPSSAVFTHHPLSFSFLLLLLVLLLTPTYPPSFPHPFLLPWVFAGVYAGMAVV
ncbi:hypothetical protein L873DRAFT_1005692 [Choiromyces venosus 120613-1]|uniref:Uncharacterized protein n=1 Tax=Choiromyces venosus 120613-1 TaxID=1336337 RepID=A0A3N4JRB0_9PEZI|nr:hypothetical protein L873DRAFT_1005692 [Choiromyces venosus 120613-1]